LVSVQKTDSTNRPHLPPPHSLHAQRKWDHHHHFHGATQMIF